MYTVQMKNITKHFGPVIANNNVNFDLEMGEIHTLLGENGAGKTTLMRILYGLYKEDSGEVYVNGNMVSISSPKDAIHYGIGMVTQHFTLVPTLTVAENLILGRAKSINLNPKAYNELIATASKKFGIEVDPSALVKHLSVGERQRVEILKALYRDAKVLILDEPTAVLVPQEVEQLFEVLNRLISDGLSVIFISHKLNEVMEISDRITVLRDGKVEGTVYKKDTSQNELARLMVGRETFGVQKQLNDKELGNLILQVKNITAKDKKGLTVLKNVNLDVRQNEILGLAGVSGNGQSQLTSILTGVEKPTAGKIILEDKDITDYSPSQITKSKVGRIPEDRHAGVVGELTVAENLALEELDIFSKKITLDKPKINNNAKELIEEYQIKARPSDRTRKLSGGNIQKVILARALSKEPILVIASEPTRGLDIGATEYVRNKLLDQRDRGAAVLLISEDLDEILALSDRIAVIYEGEIMDIVPAKTANAEQLGLLMSGATKDKSIEFIN